MKTIILAALSISLVGCGGGSSSSSPPQSNTQPITQAISNIADNTPTTAPFLGAFTSINGINNGWIAGPSKQAIAEGLGRSVANSPTTYPEFYKSLIGEGGLRVTLAGEKIGVGAVSGLPIYAAEAVFLVTLRNDGLHVVQIA